VIAAEHVVPVSAAHRKDRKTSDVNGEPEPHLRLPFTAVGTELSINTNGKPTRAVVAPMPFLDPEGTRLRA
jgi:hypothetical protein